MARVVLALYCFVEEADALPHDPLDGDPVFPFFCEEDVADNADEGERFGVTVVLPFGVDFILVSFLVADVGDFIFDFVSTTVVICCCCSCSCSFFFEATSAVALIRFFNGLLNVVVEPLELLMLVTLSGSRERFFVTSAEEDT